MTRHVLNLILLLLFLGADVAGDLRVGGIVVRTHLVNVYLTYLVFRKPFVDVFAGVAFYAIMVKPFTGLSFLHVFLAVSAMLYCLFRVREQIYTESYLTMALWTFLFTLAEQCFLHLISSPQPFTSFPALTLPLLSGSLFSAMLALPLFMALDRLNDRLGMTDGDEGAGFLKGRLK